MTAITKNKEQHIYNAFDVDLGEKEVYQLDADQRIVDFVMQPSIAMNSVVTGGDIKTTVTVIDTLPHHMTYKPGSSYYGGTYRQTSMLYGGTRGLSLTAL